MNVACGNVMRRGLTLVETAITISLTGVIALVVSAASMRFSEDARATKCLDNLKRGMHAVLQHTAEHDGTLPGPVHPAIKRQAHDMTGSINAEADRKKSLTWLLRPYLTPGDPSNLDSTLPNTVVDELFRCPTATMIAPDRDFLNADTGSCWVERPYSYAANSYGPIGSPGSTDFSTTNPPHYFGAWFYCDGTPERYDTSWWPKRLDAIPNASAEWALADAWYRRNSTAGGRGGGTRRQWKGTYAPATYSYLPRIPSTPYHRVNPRSARSSWAQGMAILPKVDLPGETNQAYIDGHVAPFVGEWDAVGTGGTVNSMWDRYGGSEHASEYTWKP